MFPYRVKQLTSCDFSRVKLPKTFLAINLSDAFSFEEIDKLGSDFEGAGELLEMKSHSVSTKDATPADAGLEASEGCAVVDDEDEAPAAAAAAS